ncbi:hypothetical protein [Emticicia agri]|uniref:Auto-transporter adhesin head GIN domain-containing protein n=1 Tax=Emticicia agri TaxID=2492393 RepID=A0A4Q5LVZ9_9BACT|nr:hypothetical protein [Emticicia agri]RYU93862.1 hypothetical protein EWM59_19675 [Emticicia agri]
MKLKLFILSIVFFSQKLSAQFTVIQPEAFRLASNNISTHCPDSYIGRIFYDINDNTVKYCIGNLDSKATIPIWEGEADIYYMGKVGISQNIPSYELDILGKANINTLSIDGKVGINTETPVEKLELVNRDMVIRSSADTKSWVLATIFGSNRFEFREQGAGGRMIIKNNGNIDIGTISVTTDKLRVDGNVSYAGSLSVQGKGTLANTSSAQLKMITITSPATSANFYIDGNTCKTLGFSFGNNSIFTQPPVVVIGQKNTGSSNVEKIVLSVETITNTGGYIRFCNITSGEISIPNVSFSLMAIGQ